ncbi:uncharacterized protein LOC132938700 [Metopolophium dirhodum]|uniref:uncharacterized protein LOC132936815 n=1 Tax=Metopolophium dirhodum TaxID=44670 RepID=UPI00298FD9AD|nr:uncharacterized protein LOC132936815 [Metopolophium dirhodum]XP_060861672.1 uncharacterized protein LOC132938700 [Metopolophium dirhodum]
MDFQKVVYQILLLLFTIEISTTFGNHEEDLFELTSTSDSPGLQYELIGNGRACGSSWTVNTYMDLKFLNNSLRNIRQMLNSIELIAFKDISITLYQLKKHANRLENEIGLIVQMGRHNKKVKRSIEFGGTALKWMFGVADADDVRRYDSTIDKLENNEKDVMRIVHDQISILKSTIINFNDSVTSFNENKKIFDANMKEGEKKVNELIIEIAKEDRKIIILSSITLLENTIFELDMFISRLQRVISNVQNNVVDAFIITPDQLLSEIKNIQSILPDDLKIPVKFDEDNIQEIFKILSIEMHTINDRFIFSLKFPLCLIENFNVYYILPIYIPINEHGQFLHMTKNSMYLLMDKIMTKYFIWPDLNNCKVVDKIFVCGFNEIIHNCDTDPTCVTELLKNSLTKPPQCDTYISEFKTEMWYPSFFKNHWFFVCEKPTTITIICNKQSFTQKIKVKSSGKLYLKSGCIAYTSKGVLKTEQVLNQTYFSIPVDLSLTNDSCCNVFNFSNQAYPKPIHFDEIKNIKFNKDAFNTINKQLDQQDMLINSLIVDKTYEFIYTNKYLVVIIIVFLIYFIAKFYLNRKAKQLAIENINLSYNPPSSKN